MTGRLMGFVLAAIAVVSIGQHANAALDHKVASVEWQIDHAGEDAIYTAPTPAFNTAATR